MKQNRRFNLLLKLGLSLILAFGHYLISFSQTNVNNTFQTTSEFVPVIKESAKFSDLPEIKDSVKRISNINYGIASNPLFPRYQVQKIDAAKMQNEPLSKLYHSLLKIGYGPLYNTPYGEVFISNLRSRDIVFGGHYKHYSSSTTLDDVGYSGFSDNIAGIYGKKFYKKHTLSCDLGYSRNVVHFYGYNLNVNHIASTNFIKQRFQLFEPKLVLQSHYTDSTHINHRVTAGFYNLQNLYREAENNIKVNADATMFINHEKLNVGLYTDYYNHKQSNDTINDLIVSLAPSFEAQGEKWNASLGIKGTVDNFKNKTRFYFYPQLNLQYNVYENVLIPYVGVTGGLMKNSLRSLSNENPFIDTTLNYTNSNNKYKIFGGLKGNLSSNTSYDVNGSYSQVDSMHFYVVNYRDINMLYNQFDILYDNASVINLSGQIKYQLKEKIHFITKGNYYLYKTKNLTRAYHKPDFDFTISAIYNLQSKIIVRADFFVIGKQWTQTQVTDAGTTTLKPKQLSGLFDANLEAEYRYSKMLSFFARFNNIANQRYYRWERYPTQRFGFMIGATFVPF